MRNKPKLAIFLSRFPYPLDKGDKLRAYHQIKYLSNHFTISLFCLLDEKISSKDLNEVKKYCVEIFTYSIPKVRRYWNGICSLIQGNPFQVGYFYEKKVCEKWVNEIELLQPAIVYCQLNRMALYVKNMSIKKVLDYQDAFSKNYSRIANETSGLKKIAYKLEGKAIAKFEKQVYDWFDKTIIISEFDKQALPLEKATTEVIQNGVDANYFVPKEVNKMYDVLFCGNLNYLPNEEACAFIKYKIAPLLIKTNPSIKIAIAGKYNGQLFNDINENSVIKVLGWQEDIREVYAQSKLFIAPLFTGAGLQNKLLEAMSMGIPCITTNIANASLGATNQEIVIANNENEFVASIIKLLEDEKTRKQLSANSRKFIIEHFDWDTENEKLVTILESLIA